MADVGGDFFAACCGACCIACVSSITTWLNFAHCGSGSGTTQRGWCRNLGESTNDDEFEQAAREKRLKERPEVLNLQPKPAVEMTKAPQAEVTPATTA